VFFPVVIFIYLLFFQLHWNRMTDLNGGDTATGIDKPLKKGFVRKQAIASYLSGGVRSEQLT